MELTIAGSVDDVSLAGVWTITSADGRFAADYAVPGDVHSALIAAGLIPHPYKGRNEIGVRWVADQDWTAARSIELSDVAASDWYLDVDYLDTVADVSINGERVLHAENCFRRYRPDVTQYLREGVNTIEIKFHSNTTAANAKQAAQPFYVPYAAQNCPIPNGNMLRKPACHFGWDWNLAIVPFGIYGNIQLRRKGNLRIEHVQVKQTHNTTAGKVTVDVDVVLRGRKDADITVTFDGVEKRRLVKGDYGDVKQRFRFDLDQPDLWWPAGQGAQRLYDLMIECDGQVERRRIGLRTIELLTDPDEAGSRFALRVNGRLMFCKGANWIPADALPSSATEELTRKLLKSAVDANMNMIRVWGGGYYEKDFFYEACDDLGLLVWQDFMFSCNLYPSTPEFLKEVQAEVDYQVRRLQHHACLALWCGDNELIGALTWFKESRENRDRYLVNYDRLNRTVETAMRAADPQGNWWPSSPSPGVLDFGDAWHADNKGDMHFWSVWHEGKDFSHYHDVKPRFCSEFGFQSFPSLAITRGFIDHEDDLNIASEVMEHHQRNAGGNARIAETMFRYFRFPKDFANFVYLSQVQHGYAMRTAVEAWRSLKPHCMGTLYWQLNDTWPVASWSGLDHGGGWKVLHHMARRFYAPVIVTSHREPSGDIVFTAVNDMPDPLDMRFAVRFVPVDGAPESSHSVNITSLGSIARPVFRIVASDVKTDGIYIYAWETEHGIKGRNHVAPVAYKKLDLKRPEIAVAGVTKGSSVGIELAATRLALFITLENDVPGQFSDNAFDLMPGEKRILTFTPDDPLRIEEVRQSLVVRDLYSSSH
jgi:beta-mannosidase